MCQHVLEIPVEANNVLRPQAHQVDICANVEPMTIDQLIVIVSV